LSGAGHGGILAAALWPELEKSGSGKGSGGLALALGGAIGGWAQGGVAGVLTSRGKATRRTNFGGGWWWSAVRFKGRKRNTPAVRGFIQAAEQGMWMRPSARSTAASSCVASCVASRAEAAPARPATGVDELVIPWITVALPYLLSFVPLRKSAKI
jgi:hypothetical protein